MTTDASFVTLGHWAVRTIEPDASLRERELFVGGAPDVDHWIVGLDEGGRLARLGCFMNQETAEKAAERIRLIANAEVPGRGTGEGAFVEPAGHTSVLWCVLDEDGARPGTLLCVGPSPDGSEYGMLGIDHPEQQFFGWFDSQAYAEQFIRFMDDLLQFTEDRVIH